MLTRIYKVDFLLTGSGHTDRRDVHQGEKNPPSGAFTDTALTRGRFPGTPVPARPPTRAGSVVVGGLAPACVLSPPHNDSLGSEYAGGNHP